MKKKILFIDRDGTLIQEPSNFQVDSFDKLHFLPNVFFYLKKIVIEMDYLLVMVTNQDGLGTESNPIEKFQPVHDFIINTFKQQEITFFKIHIDKSFEHEKTNTRKPNTGMLTEYFSPLYDLENSFVIGDRPTDIALAKNLNCKGIFIQNKNFELDKKLNNICSIKAKNWNEIYNFLNAHQRKASNIRNTNETKIAINLNLNGNGNSKINTGLKFFNHMLEQLAKHSNCDLEINVKGDLHIDEHHTIEDTAIALGETFKKALGKKLGIERYGFALPMDDAISFVAIDFGGRPWIVWDVEFKREKIGDMPTEMFFHFFKSFSDTALANIFIQCKGDNEHHKIESIFKAFAKAIKFAIKKDENNLILPSTKGIL